jgi:hypothetical protein
MSLLSEKILRWLIFSIFLSALPIVFAIFLLTIVANNEFTIAIRNGEIFIICVPICMSSPSEVLFVQSKPRLPRLRLLVGVMTIIIGIFCAFLFAATATAPIISQQPLLSSADISTYSLYMFLISLFFSYTCVLLSESE